MATRDREAPQPGQYSEHLRHWRLDPEVDFLNHGSFGACPAEVLDEQSRLRARLEAEPVRFFLREWTPLLDRAREALAGFVGARAEDLVAVPNATAGVNAVLRSLQLGPGDELVTLSYAYNACRLALERVTRDSGARAIVVPAPFPLRSPDEVICALMEAVTQRTRLVMIDHVTSATALILPVHRIVRALRERGIETLVDGAHAPGMVPLDLESLGAGWYTGNLHKWVCAPKGAGFLWVRRDLQDGIRPLVTSHGAGYCDPVGGRFHAEFDWAGTSDPTPFLSVPAALGFFARVVPGGFPAVMAANRALALAGRRRLVATLGVDEPAPEEMIGAIASVPIPPGYPTEASRAVTDVDPLQALLYDAHRIEVPISPWPRPPARVIRISAQLYNTREQYERLAAILAAALPTPPRN